MIGAANRYPEKCNLAPASARAINVDATRSLAKLCARRRILLIYISTNYVFSGTPGHAPYDVDDQPDPINLYGQTKLDGEGAVLAEYSKCGMVSFGIVLRVPILYGGEQYASESAIGVLAQVVRESQDSKGGVTKVDDWGLRAPTHTSDVGRVCHGQPDMHAAYQNDTLADICSRPVDPLPGHGRILSTPKDFALHRRGKIHQVGYLRAHGPYLGNPDEQY